MEQYRLNLTHKEACLLSDHLAPSDETDPLRLQIAHAVDASQPPATETTIAVGYGALRYFHDAIQTTMMCGQDATGYKLTLKICRGLRELAAQEVVDQAGLAASERDELDMDARQAKRFSRWKERRKHHG